jgi:deoxyribonuclease-4
MSKHQRIGLHVSAAGGVENAPENAKEVGAECFQFFSRSPRGGGAPVISDEQAELFKQRCKDYGFESYIHTPYYINFASKNNKIYHGSIAVVREELERGSKLGVKYVMTHMGSAKDHIPNGSVDVPKEAIQQAIKGLKEIFKGDPDFSTQLLLEISAGSGAVLGDTFEELAELLEGLGRKDVNICLDTCHLFASGYDLRTKEVIDETMKKFKKTLGLSRLKLVHMNDSKKELGAHRDLHEHMGKGAIGEAGIKAILHHPDFQNVNFILETKHDSFIKSDLEFLKKHRKQK